MHYTYEPQGVCSRQIEIDTDGDIIRNIKFIGGCPGNTKGVSILCQGMKIDDVIEKLKGIDCRDRGTSCPDQLAIALRRMKKEM